MHGVGGQLEASMKNRCGVDGWGWKLPSGSRLNRRNGRLITGWCGCMGLEANLRHWWRLRNRCTSHCHPHTITVPYITHVLVHEVHRVIPQDGLHLWYAGHSQCHSYHRRLAKQWKKRYIMHNSKHFTTTPLPCCCSHLNSPTPASDTTPPSTTKNGFFCISTHHEYILIFATLPYVLIESTFNTVSIKVAICIRHNFTRKSDVSKVSQGGNGLHD